MEVSVAQLESEDVQHDVEIELVKLSEGLPPCDDVVVVKERDDGRMPDDADGIDETGFEVQEPMDDVFIIPVVRDVILDEVGLDKDVSDLLVLDEKLVELEPALVSDGDELGLDKDVSELLAPDEKLVELEPVLVSDGDELGLDKDVSELLMLDEELIELERALVPDDVAVVPGEEEALMKDVAELTAEELTLDEENPVCEAVVELTTNVPVLELTTNVPVLELTTNVLVLEGCALVFEGVPALEEWMPVLEEEMLMLEEVIDEWVLISVEDVLLIAALVLVVDETMFVFEEKKLPDEELEPDSEELDVVVLIELISVVDGAELGFDKVVPVVEVALELVKEVLVLDEAGLELEDEMLAPVELPLLVETVPEE